MALPSNTDWDFSYDEDELAAGAEVITTGPLTVVRNMDYSLRRSRMIASHVWAPQPATSAAPSWSQVLFSYAYGPNALGTSVSTDIAGTVKAWASDASTAFAVRVHNASYGTLTATVAAGAGAAVASWRGWMTGTFTTPGDDTLWSYTVDAQRTWGSGTIYVAGVGLFY